MNFARPRIYASKCLGFAKCRWNGLSVESETVEKLAPFVDFVTACPEAEIGLGIPRKPVRVIEIDGVHRLYQPDLDLDHTDAMNSRIDEILGGLGDVDGFILKNRSPTCGMFDVKVYPGKSTKTAAIAKRMGFLGGAIQDRYASWPMEDEGRLTNWEIRERFFTQVFLLAGFREVRQQFTAKALIDFHARNKYLLTAFNQSRAKTLGKIVAAQKETGLADALSKYEPELRLAIRTGPRKSSVANVLMHVLGYFKKVLGPREKNHFLDLLESYRQGKQPLSALNAVIASWIERTDEQYLRYQTFFRPYPDELIDITSSGQGRTYRK